MSNFSPKWSFKFTADPQGRKAQSTQAGLSNLLSETLGMGETLITFIQCLCIAFKEILCSNTETDSRFHYLCKIQL